MCFLLRYLLLCAVAYSSDGLSNELLNTDPTSMSITISCKSELPAFDPKTVQDLTLNCTLPNKPYTELIKKLQITSLQSLTLNIEPSKTNITLPPILFQHLNVTKLVINYNYINESGKVNLMQVNSELIYKLYGVKELTLYGVTVFEDNVMRRDDIEPKYCDLRILRIVASDIRLVPNGWLRACKQLVALHLSQLRQRNGTKAVRRKVLAGAKSLRTLEILNCFIEELEDELEDLENLETLNVAHNQIHYALTTIVLPNLVVLDLSHNHLFSSALLSSGVEKQPRLRVLSLDYNTVLNICDNLGYRTTVVEQEDSVATWHNPLNDRALTLNTIQRFSLRGTITTKMCFGHLHMDSLEYFDLSNSKISSIDFAALPVSKARRLEVNVTGCPIPDIPGYTFDESQYNRLRHEELRISGLNVTLSCDCDQYLWLVKASRNRKLILDGAFCEGGHHLTTIPDDQLQCTKYYCDVCMCRRYWQNNATDMTCTGDLENMPKEPGLRKLYASGNQLENVTANDLPDSLIFLDLRKNRIARMSEEATKALFKRPTRRVRFYGNPIICDCENRPFIEGLMDHFDQVEDYSNLTCIDDGRFIRNVDPGDLCFGTSRMFLTTLIASLGALIGIVALFFGLYYRFGKTVKVYLFSKGLCLFCIREEEIDADRPYDAFISFSHKDESYVTHDLLPGLENEPYNYNICVHYRNWIAGELIPTQIKESIEKSKRTIVVLTKSFLDSIWGLLEFRTAHLSALKEGRNRLIIIIADDILETGNLDGELRTYLRTNTYVKKDDPWFWDKLRYALPHRSSIMIRAQKTMPHSNINKAYIPTKEDDNNKSEEDQNIPEIPLDPKKSFDSVVTAEINTDFDNDGKYLNVTAIDRQVSKDSAIEMEKYSD